MMLFSSEVFGYSLVETARSLLGGSLMSRRLQQAQASMRFSLTVKGTYMDKFSESL